MHAVLDDVQLASQIQAGIAQRDFRGQRVLVLIPDATRTMPMPRYFSMVCAALRRAGAHLQTWMVALGTHPAMDAAALNQLLGCDVAQVCANESDIQVVNHAWQDPQTLVQIGIIDSATMTRLSGGLYTDDVPVRINRAVLTHDHIVICGPVFPHEVVG
ncbi:MAG: lactate racemase domain-containing protein, partial [Roseiflexaceae bacterium]